MSEKPDGNADSEEFVRALHVTEGKVQVVSNAGNESALLVAGDAVRVPVTGPIERFPSDGRHFATG